MTDRNETGRFKYKYGKAAALSLTDEQRQVRYYGYIRGVGRHCACCGILRSIDNFYRLKASRSGYMAMCKICRNEPDRKARRELSDKNYEAKSVEKRRATYRAWAKRNSFKCKMHRQTWYYKHQKAITKKAQEQRKLPFNKLRTMVEIFNKSYKCKLNLKEVRAFWLEHLEFLRAMRRWKSKQYSISSSPSFTPLSKENLNVSQLQITTMGRTRSLIAKRNHLGRCGIHARLLRKQGRFAGLPTPNLNK